MHFTVVKTHSKLHVLKKIYQDTYINNWDNQSHNFAKCCGPEDVMVVSILLIPTLSRIMNGKKRTESWDFQETLLCNVGISLWFETYKFCSLQGPMPWVASGSWCSLENLCLLCRDIEVLLDGMVHGSSLSWQFKTHFRRERYLRIEVYTLSLLNI